MSTLITANLISKAGLQPFSSSQYDVEPKAILIRIQDNGGVVFFGIGTNHMNRTINSQRPGSYILGKVPGLTASSFEDSLRSLLKEKLGLSMATNKSFSATDILMVLESDGGLFATYESMAGGEGFKLG